MKRKIKSPLMNITAKRRTFLVTSHAGYLYPPSRIKDVSFKSDSGFVTLKPGVETEIIKALPRVKNNIILPKEAKLNNIEAQISVEKEDPGLKAEIMEGEGKPRCFTVLVDGPTLPSNVSLKLIEGDVFWFSVGELVKKTYSIKNFAENVNSYLNNFWNDSEEVYLRFLIKSDTPGKVKLTINAIKDDDYSIINPQEWSNPLDDTIRIDRNYQLDYCKIQLEELNIGSDHTSSQSFPIKIDFDIGGELRSERVFGSIEEHDGKRFAAISRDYSFAQKIELKKTEYESGKPLNCIGIVGFFLSLEIAELYIEIQKDLNRFPNTGSPLATSNISLAKSEGNKNGSWIFIEFDSSFDLKPDTPYWILIKSVQGSVQLALQNQDDAYLKEVLVNRGGQTWKSIGNPSDIIDSSLVRLIYLPEYDNQTSAIEIGIKGTPFNEQIDPGPEAQSVSFNLQGNEVLNPIIKIKSHSRGTVSIVNVIQEYSAI